MALLIKNGIIIDPLNKVDGKKADLLVEGNVITKVGENLKAEGAEIYDAAGKYVCPGFLDMHCHLREPGSEGKEKISTGTRSAAVGGFTSVACMPNTNPVIDTVLGVRFIQMLAEKEGVVNVYPIAAITKKQAGEELTEIGDLVEEGVVAVSDDGVSVMNAELMRNALEYCKMFNIPIIQHPEDKNLSEGGTINEGYVSTLTGLKGIPSIAEEIIIARDILIAKYTKARLHLTHISTKGSVELIRQGKKDGVNVTCDCTGHHFTLTEEKLKTFDSNYKINPPLRTAEDVEALIAGLADGTIDAIASDHAPHTIFEKEQEFDYAPFGIIGFETLVPLTFTQLVNKGKITPYQAVEKFTKNPYFILNIKNDGLKEGAVADITVVDPNLEFILKKEEIVSKSCNTPFIGTKFKGAAVLTVVAGKVVMKDRKVLL